jgi:type II secretory pathway component PulF
MPQYRCVVVDAAGGKRELIRAASSPCEAAMSFSTGNLFLLSIEPFEKRTASSRGISISAAALGEFTEMTALLLESGMGLREALGIEADIAGEKIRSLSAELLSEIDKGDSLSAAFDRRPASFSPLYRGMVRIGERVGSLQTVIPQLASWLKDRRAFRDKLSGALAYPLLVLVVALLGTAGMAFFLLPRLQGFFQELGESGATDLQDRVRFASRFFRGLAAAFIAGAAAFIALWAARKREGVAAVSIDRAVLSLPVVGRFVKDWETLNFAFAMEILTRGGVPMESALMEAARTSENAAFRAAILSARKDLVKGGSLSAALGARKEIPAYVTRWIGAGERSGQPDRVFAQVRFYFQAEIDRGVSRFTTLLEPALIVLVGGVVLFLVVSFVLPLFSLYGSLL